MKKTIVSVVVVLLACWIVFPSIGVSKSEFAKKEGVACTACHTGAPSKDNLNEVGKCYKNNNFSFGEKCPKPAK